MLSFYQKEEVDRTRRVALRESAIQAPKTQRTSRQRELTPAPCLVMLVDNEVTVDDLQWCFEEMKDWNTKDPYITYCTNCDLLCMKRLALVDFLSSKHRRDSIGHRYGQCFRCNDGGPVMILDLRTVRRWGAPLEDTDKAESL